MFKSSNFSYTSSSPFLSQVPLDDLNSLNFSEDYLLNPKPKSILANFGLTSHLSSFADNIQEPESFSPDFPPLNPNPNQTQSIQKHLIPPSSNQFKSNKWTNYWLTALRSKMHDFFLDSTDQKTFQYFVKKYLERNSGDPIYIPISCLFEFFNSQPFSYKSRAIESLQFFYQLVRSSPSHMQEIKKIEIEFAKTKWQLKRISPWLEKIRHYMNLENKSDRTKESYTAILKEYLIHLNSDPCEEDKNQIEFYLVKLRTTRKLNSATVNLHAAAIAFFYKRVIKAPILLDEIPRMKNRRPLPKVYSRTTIEKILNAHSNSKHQLVLVLAYACGLRLNEIRQLTPADLDFSRKLVWVRHGKGDKDRCVMMDRTLYKRLKKYLHQNPNQPFLLMGQKQGKPLSPKSLDLIFSSACTKANVVRLGGIHTLRHSFATHLLEKGVDVHHIQKILGHTNIKTTLIYLHVSNKDLVSIPSPIQGMKLL